jgi:hypothetical protein
MRLPPWLTINIKLFPLISQYHIVKWTVYRFRSRTHRCSQSVQYNRNCIFSHHYAVAKKYPNAPEIRILLRGAKKTKWAWKLASHLSNGRDFLLINFFLLKAIYFQFLHWKSIQGTKINQPRNVGGEKDDHWFWGVTLKINYFNGMLLYKAMYNWCCRQRYLNNQIRPRESQMPSQVWCWAIGTRINLNYSSIIGSTRPTLMV